jgi:hypothetical protein
VVRDLADAIHAGGSEDPLAIVLEDIHWADNSTLLALRSLATARPDAPVLWGADRPHRGRRAGAPGDLVGAATANAAVLRVAAMSASAVADMVCDAVRANADESLLNLAAKAHGILPGQGAGRGSGRGGPAQCQAAGVRGQRTRAAATAGRRYAAATRPALRGAGEVVRVACGAAGPVLGWSAGRDAGPPAGVVDVGARGGGARGSARRRR